jgi:hypothetical protein
MNDSTSATSRSESDKCKAAEELPPEHDRWRRCPAPPCTCSTPARSIPTQDGSRLAARAAIFLRFGSAILAILADSEGRRQGDGIASTRLAPAWT